MNIRIRKSTALILLATFTFDLLAPAASFALSAGPSQPEMQSFEPVGTTDMVNPFSGDFTYNIPLLDVDGYPVNIAYHSGASIEQEASWVGLGWNINPGNISHGIRGIPDDFNGEKIDKKLKINDEFTKRFGMLFTLEVAGVNLGKAVEGIAKMLKINLGGSVNMGISINNYTGVSGSVGLGSNIGISNSWMSAGVNIGATFTTDQGVDIDAGVSAGLNSKSSGTVTTAVNGSFAKGYNSREGLKYTSFGVNPSFSCKGIAHRDEDGNRISGSGRLGTPEGVSNTMVPISMQNFVPVITNANFMESSFYQFKFGIEASATIYPNFGGNYGEDKVKFQEDGSRAAYGFFNLQNATKDDITDFTRDKDGRFNRDMQYLPAGNMTYDIYSVNGQATGGNFRPFRNDVGAVYDPYTNSDKSIKNDLVELGVGNIFEAGWDHVSSYTSASSGPWNRYKNSFSKKKAGSLFEPHYFKQAGELTEPSAAFNTAIQGAKPLTTADIGALNASPMEGGGPWADDNLARQRRANLLYYFTAEEASNPGISMEPDMSNYTTPGSLAHTPISRLSNNRKPYHASEFTQLLPDGRRYIYGIPAMNNQQIEYVVSCGAPSGNDGTVDINAQGLQPYGQSNASSSQVIGQNLYMKTSTPAFAHSYLLTEILSTDYADLTGNGITDDDLGAYTKFNYSLKDPNFAWRTPSLVGQAQYDKGVASDCHDDKATFITGSKEIWMLHSIETKNFLAYFYTSQRSDNRGSIDNQALPGASQGGYTYKLDSIALYSKQERLANPTGAVPVKRVFFTYDYSLCKGVTNATSTANGKLTLKAISIKFGNSDIGMLSPYRFKYSSFNPDYKIDGKDMWGNYKPHSGNGALSLSNHDFPYVRQDSASANENATAWNLTNIKLPSGGEIKIKYEADDYAFVQDRRAMEMFKVEGVGPDKRFVQGSALYQSQTNPYLYIYFTRKRDGNGNLNELYNDIPKAYLDNGNLIQYNFKVKMSATGETLPSCGIPLEDHVKGYAAVEDIGVCDGDVTKGYIKLAPKTVDKMPSLNAVNASNLSLNPVTLTSIFYAKYYNAKALYPSSEIVNANDPVPLIKQMMSSFMEISDYFRSPITKYLNQGRAKYVDLSQSYVRLCSQGRKIGGGQRVKRIEFTDNWDQVSSAGQPVANYGSDYDYTIDDIAGGKKISSGVATYEPLYGGDENPMREPIATDKIGQKKDFPVVIPTELTIEGPIGETMYPSPDVGYSKVTITSIHKDEGESSQTIQEHEYYTAKDFPARSLNTPIEKLEDRKIKAFDLSFEKKEAYRLGQGYSLFFNDMHGKPKVERVLLRKGAGAPTVVSYKKYEYFTNKDGTLKNEVPCINNDPTYSFTPGNVTLGVETDIMLDSREKLEETRTKGFMANLNTFLIGSFAIPIPTAFPKFPKSVEKAFSSIVCTKIIQQYGILKSVETFDKGATVTMSNDLFDPATGTPLVTKVNTEHNDAELQVKFPAYWAYRCMGHAYKNILYEENITDNASVVADSFYLKTTHPDRFNIGDELLFKLNKSCIQGTNTPPQTYKLWVVDKKSAQPATVVIPQCTCVPNPTLGIRYLVHHNCKDNNGYHTNESVNYPATGFPQNTTPPSELHSDNICNVNYNGMLNYNGSGANTLKDLLQPASGSSLFPELTALLFGNNKYPVEAMNMYWTLGDADYPDFRETHDNPYVLFHQDDRYIIPPPPANQTPQFYPAYDTIFLNSKDAPWHHFGVKSGITRFKGEVGPGYSSYFPGCPIINQASKLVKVTVILSSKTDTYVMDGSGSSAFAFKLQDYNNPLGNRTNLYYQCKYELYLPYVANNAYLTAGVVQAMNHTNVKWSDINGDLGEKTLRNPGYYAALTTRDNFIAAHPGDQTNWGGYPNNISWLPVQIGGNTYTGAYDNMQWYFSSTAEIIERSSIDGYEPGNIIVAMPRKREVPSYEPQQKPFPRNDRVFEGSVKVIRSGRRNQLTETVQDAAMTADKSASYGYNLNLAFSKLINAGAQTYTDVAAASGTIADPGTEYYNPMATGRRGNYRILQKYNLNVARDYSADTDPGKGIINNLYSFWEYNSAWQYGAPGDFYNRVTPPNQYTTKWIPQTWVKTYSPWGSDLEVQDAAGNIQSNLFDYGNNMPVATIKNASWDNALYLNFEDAPAPVTILDFYQNELQKTLRQSANVSFTTAVHHTGRYALNVASYLGINLPVNNTAPPDFPARGLYPFHFRPGKKYILSYWQQMAQNTNTAGLLSGISVTAAGTTTLALPKTPIIDGWVMYEREFTVPATLNGGNVMINLRPGYFVDDIRIMPVEANMKCYVYHPLNHKVVAMLDENHMASIFEYDQEGKLVRIKKETEKGMLTIKESRGSVHSVIQTANGNGTTPLTN